MAEGRSNAGIAESLTVTVAAVERHITAIFDKLDLKPEIQITMAGCWRSLRYL